MNNFAVNVTDVTVKKIALCADSKSQEYGHA
jgi:hypothetical protein